MRLKGELILRWLFNDALSMEAVASMVNEYGADGGNSCERGNRTEGLLKDCSYLCLQGTVTRQMNQSFYCPSCRSFCREGAPCRRVLLRLHPVSGVRRPVHPAKHCQTFGPIRLACILTDSASRLSVCREESRTRYDFFGGSWVNSKYVAN
jgi:hypothetical protein